MLIIDNYRRSQRGRWKDTFAERHSVHFSSTWNFAKKYSEWSEICSIFWYFFAKNFLLLFAPKIIAKVCCVRLADFSQPLCNESSFRTFFFYFQNLKKTLFSWEGPDPFNHIYLQILSFPISNKYVFESVLKNVTSNSAISKDHVSNHYYDHLFLTSKMF